jgi:hypothetical protein
MNKIERKIMKTLGANWRTSLSGLIAVAAVVINQSPQLISFLPGNTQNAINGWAGLIAAIAAGYFVINTKDKQVTGGTVVQDSNFKEVATVKEVEVKKDG